MGHSIGKYEGDTLVVDTVGINDKSWIDRVGHPHSDALHLVERFRRVNNTLEYEYTIDDPETYNQPWQAAVRYRKVQQPYVEEVCAEGNFLLFDYGIPTAKQADF